MQKIKEIHGILVEDIPVRKPIVDNESILQFSNKEITRQWNLVTEVIMREIQLNPELRKSLLALSNEQADETLASKLVSLSITSSPRVHQITQRYNDTVIKYLNLPSIPDEFLGKDFRHVRYLEHPTDKNKVDRYLDENFGGKELLERDIARGIFEKGITVEEKKMAIQRYRFARDAKLIIFAVEMIEQNLVGQTINDKTILPSGTEFHLLNKGFETNILNPINWEKRTMIKDRVYKITIKGKIYILKEKKTNRHTDTIKNGHLNGLSSEDEFKTAKFLKEYASIKFPNKKISVNWESPIGYVNFPDGFQFTIFEYENDLIEDRNLLEKKLYKMIIENKKQFEEEYQWTKQHYAKFLKHSLINRPRIDIARIMGFKPKLTFESFAKVKTLSWIMKARDLMIDLLLKNEYSNSDKDGYAYKITNKKEIMLEIIGIDFEYYHKITSERRNEIANNGKRKDNILENLKMQLPFNWWDESRTSDAEQAAMIALSKKE
jgi:hypothetical protein